MKTKYFLILLILVFTISCGFPDASSIYVDMNQPYITRVSPGNNEFTVYFEAQNNEENFSGYSISYGDNLNQKIYIMLNDNQLLPVMRTDKSATIQQYQFTIGLGQSYSNSTNGISRLQASDIANGYPYYMVVTAYDLFNNRESSYSYDYYVALAAPRPEVNNQTVSVGGNFSGISGYNLATLIDNGVTLQLQPSSGSAIQMHYATSLDDINYPPLSGYSVNAIDVLPQRLYLMTTVNSSGETCYAKIFISSVGASSVVADYAVQTAVGVTNY